VRSKQPVRHHDKPVVHKQHEWFSQSHFEVKNATGIVADRNGYLPGPPATPGATDANPVTGTILFENPALDDWRVKAGGATIDKGGLVPVSRDFRGMPRPQAPGSSSPSLSVPNCLPPGLVLLRGLWSRRALHSGLSVP
jgi:hypothetical protein